MAKTIKPSFSLMKHTPLSAVIPFGFFALLSAINLYIGIRVFRNPGSFPSSYWDIRWAILFAIAFFGVGLLSILAKRKILFILSLASGAILIILPMFTIGIGKAYLVLILLIAIAYAIGEFVLRRLLGCRLPGSLELFAFSILLGFGFIAVLVMIQGMLFAYQPWVTWVGLAGLTGVFVLPHIKRWSLQARNTYSDLRQFWSTGPGLGWAFALGIFVILWVPSWLISLAPANRYDELTYHLAGPMFYIKNGGIVPFPEGGLTGWMHYAEMLYTLALQTAGQPLPRMLHLLIGGISVLLVFLIGKRLINTRAGILAAILFAAVPAVGYESATAYIDLFTTAYTTAFGFALLIWWQQQDQRWLLTAGLLGGFALGIKLSAGAMLAGLVILLIAVLLLEHRFSKNLPRVIAMLALILALALPWLIRDFLWTGDPFYPYSSMFFQKYASSIGASDTTASTPGSSIFLRLLRYPVDLVFDSYSNYREAPGGFASALPLLALPLFVSSRSIARKTKFVGIGMLIATVIAVGIMIFINSALLRYAFPILPWLAICAALNLEGFCLWLTELPRSQWQIISLGLTLLVYVFSTRLPLIMRPYDNLPQRFPLSYFLGRESRDSFLSRTLAVYDAYHFIDSQPGGPHRVLSIGNEFRLYTNSRIDGIYDVREASQTIASAKTPSELAQWMEKNHYDYILFNQPEVDFVAWKYADPYPMLQNQLFWDTYARLVYIKNGMYVYHFEPKGMVLLPTENRLKNSGFEKIVAGNQVADWEEHGAVEVSSDAYQGSSSLYLHAPLSSDGGGEVVQRVPAQENTIYTVGYWLQAKPNAVFLIRVSWLDQNQKPISSIEQWRNVDASWKQYTLSFQSPPGTRYAEVHASLGNKNGAWVDAVCFAAGQKCSEPDLH